MVVLVPPFYIRSTLLSQMVSTVPGVKAISEPYSFVYLHGMYMRKHITMEDYRQLLKALVRIQFKNMKKEVRLDKCHLSRKTIFEASSGPFRIPGTHL